MIEKGDIAVYLAEVQRMQMEADKVVITITWFPDICGFGVRFGEEEGDGDLFYVLREYHKNENLCQMERIRETYNKYEKR